jgi:hypothetical protein
MSEVKEANVSKEFNGRNESLKGHQDFTVVII